MHFNLYKYKNIDRFMIDRVLPWFSRQEILLTMNRWELHEENEILCRTQYFTTCDGYWIKLGHSVLHNLVSSTVPVRHSQ